MTEHPENNPEDEVMQYVDKLIYLDGGVLLMGRILVNHNDTESFVCVFRPAEICIDELAQTTMRPWIPESEDDFFTIPVGKVLNVCAPKSEILDAYLATYCAPVDEDESPYEEIPHGAEKVIH